MISKSFFKPLVFFFFIQVQRRDGLLSERRRQVARLARWRDTETKEIFDREARKRFDDQHLQNRRKVFNQSIHHMNNILLKKSINPRTTMGRS